MLKSKCCRWKKNNLNLARQVIWRLGGAGYFLSLMWLSQWLGSVRENNFSFIKAIFEITTCCKWPILLEFSSGLLMLFHYWHTLCPLGSHIHHPGNSELRAIMLMWYHTVSICLLRVQKKKERKVPLGLCVWGNLTWVSAILFVFCKYFTLGRY